MQMHGARAGGPHVEVLALSVEAMKLDRSVVPSLLDAFVGQLVTSRISPVSRGCHH